MVLIETFIRPGVYFIKVMPLYYYSVLYEMFYNEGVEIMSHPHVIMFNSYKVHIRNRNQFPQSSCLLRSVAQLSGSKCKTRKTKLNFSFHLEHFKKRNNLSGMFNVASMK